jgi:hypothetical protein
MLPRLRRFSVAAVLTAVLALALANPFCCHLLPFYSAEVVQTETAFDTVDASCAGKPEAVADGGLVLALPPGLGLPVSILPVLLSHVEPAVARERPETGGPPRHKLLEIYRV